ncbi:kelch-like protein 30 isoform X3 [Eschrichtius robustus]|uniref:kelch-like protein 30 isoform X3 n=1 Tax=Eschrichtius robustus TaxID=9764 RepID=UPI0035C0AECD
MVWNVDDLDFHLPSHAQDMLDGLRRLRSQPKLADVTLLVGGRELPCHRGLLALSSPYFHAMFAGDFAESFSARVELRDLEPAVVAQLVDFVYTGRLTITQGNVEALTRTAARLHFPAVQKVCGRYLQQQLDATNCLGICEFGEQQGLLGVAAKAWAFLRENFEAVAQEDEFLQLSQERLATCLAGDLLQVQPEQSRLEALLRWVRHDPQARATHLPELLGLVHLDAVPRPRVQQLLATEPLIRESEACREALSQGHEGALLGLPQELEEVLVVVGGQALEDEEEEGGAQELAPRPGNFAFYDTRASTTLDVVEVESYDPYTDTWTPVSPALKYVSNFSAAGCQGRLYLVGSSACKYNALALQCYNPVTDAWSVIASPFLPKYLSSPRCAALHGALYLVGDNTKKVYVYDPGANLWQKVSQPHLPGRPHLDPRPCREQAWGRWGLGMSPPGEVGTVNGDTGAQSPPEDGRAGGPRAAGHGGRSAPSPQRLSSSSGGKPGLSRGGGVTQGPVDSETALPSWCRPGPTGSESPGPGGGQAREGIPELWKRGAASPRHPIPPTPIAATPSLLHQAQGTGQWVDLWGQRSPGLPPCFFPRRRRDTAQSPWWPQH